MIVQRFEVKYKAYDKKKFVGYIYAASKDEAMKEAKERYPKVISIKPMSVQE